MTGDRVLSEVKSPTTPDVTRGVVDAMGRLVAAAPRDARIEAVMSGTPTSRTPSRSASVVEPRSTDRGLRL
jgi:hypothetical protein